ncbi:hypothetical protein OOK31_13045 [Streptomyces sp. NBC_00249]|uniref:hypothetical protein n=1 Tax=Streptomyces sp. NBC_00249 TaxID=2975690 RepID=UPI0022561702|nr:hypothetical protein [Streptomyces sp. NBC_00249]MCX5194814.1 hypothetical protein [Streptomyces sp. NBC_00249]
MHRLPPWPRPRQGTTTTAARSAYVRAEVRHPAAAPPLPGAPAALTNPIRLTAA